jgi:hypothetical protein
MASWSGSKRQLGDKVVDMKPIAPTREGGHPLKVNLTGVAKPEAFLIHYIGQTEF